MKKRKELASSGITPVKKKLTNKYFCYSQDQLMKAIEANKKGLSLRSASDKYDVPFATLQNKVSGKSKVGAKSGRGTHLSAEVEEEIVKWIVAVGEAGFPPAPEQILDSVQKIVIGLKKENLPFINKRPGRRWFDGFLSRHKKLSLRTPQNLSKRRAEVTEQKLRKWFEEVQKHLKLEHLLDIGAERVFNCDETAALLNPKGKKVIVPRTAKSVHARVGADDKECMTVLTMGNAAGNLAPSMVIYAYQRLPGDVIDKAPKDWAIGKSTSGWMTSETFFEYISNIFYPWVKSQNIKFPIILYLDGHSSHLTMHLSDFCVDHGIVLVALYPNSTHVTQPMDVGLFSSLKKAWRKTVTDWRLAHGGAALSKINFPTVFKDALDSLDTETILKNSFKTCGLHPFNPNAPKYSHLFNYKQNQDENVPEAEPQSSLVDNEKNAAQITLHYFEKNTSAQLLELFKICSERDKIWQGEQKYQGLFEFWLHCTEEKNGEHEKIGMDVSTCLQNDLVRITEDEIISLEDLQVIELEIDSDNNISNLDLSTLDTIHDYNKTASVEEPPERVKINSLFIPPEDPLSQASQFTDRKLTNDQNLSKIFKEALFYPDVEKLNERKRPPKEKVPAVASGETWRLWKRQKIEDKKLEIETKEEKRLAKEAETVLKLEEAEEIKKRKQIEKENREFEAEIRKIEIEMRKEIMKKEREARKAKLLEVKARNQAKTLLKKTINNDKENIDINNNKEHT